MRDEMFSKDVIMFEFWSKYDFWIKKMFSEPFWGLEKVSRERFQFLKTDFQSSISNFEVELDFQKKIAKTNEIDAKIRFQSSKFAKHLMFLDCAEVTDYYGYTYAVCYKELKKKN